MLEIKFKQLLNFEVKFVIFSHIQAYHSLEVISNTLKIRLTELQQGRLHRNPGLRRPLDLRHRPVNPPYGFHNPGLSKRCRMLRQLLHDGLTEPAILNPVVHPTQDPRRIGNAFLFANL